MELSTLDPSGKTSSVSASLRFSVVVYNAPSVTITFFSKLSALILGQLLNALPPIVLSPLKVTVSKALQLLNTPCLNSTSPSKVTDFKAEQFEKRLFSTLEPSGNTSSVSALFGFAMVVYNAPSVTITFFSKFMSLILGQLLNALPPIVLSPLKVTVSKALQLLNTPCPNSTSPSNVTDFKAE